MATTRIPTKKKTSPSVTTITVKPVADAHGTRTKRDGDDDDDDDREENDEENPTKLREPFAFVKWIASHPRLSFGVALGVHLFFLALSGILVVSGYDLFPANFETLPLELREEPWLKREYAWESRDQYPDRVNRTLPSDKYPSWDRAFTREAMLVIYDAGDDSNILTKAKLREMRNIERRLAGVPRFSSYCQMTRAGTCQPFLSLLRFFDGTYASVNPVFNDSDFDSIEKVVYAAKTNNETNAALTYVLGKDSEISAASATCGLARTLVPFGWPLSGYEDEDAALEALTDFMADDMQPVLDSCLDSSDVFRLVYYNEQLTYRDAFQLAMRDMGLVAGSVLFIFLFVWFHTGSLWVTSMAVLSIVCSFAETNIVYRAVIGFEYFGFFHIIAMFIILGIGADDLFVFWDAWRATGLRRYPSLAHRLNDAYRKSVISMLVTSVTTMTAFLANAVSPFLATMSFGSFAAILVVVNYLSVVMFFPTIIVFHHLYIENKYHSCCCCCCCCWKKKAGKNYETDDLSSQHTGSETIVAISGGNATTINNYNNNNTKNASTTTIITTNNNINNNKNTSATTTTNNNYHMVLARAGRVFPTTHLPGNGKDASSAGTSRNPTPPPASYKASRLVVFFRDYYFALVTHRVARWVIVAGLLSCLAGLTYSASRLEPDNEQVQLYTDDHQYSRALKLNREGFAPSARQELNVTVYLVWGLRESDLSACHFSAVECRGDRGVFDDSFDASTVAAQRALVATCEALFNFTQDQVSDYAVKRNVVTGQLEIACFPRNMETFLKGDPVSSSVDVSLPWDWKKASDFMTSLNTYYDSSAFNSSFDQFLDIPLTYWIWDGFRQNNTEDYQLFNSLFGEEMHTYTSSILTSPSILTGNRIKYLSIAVNTTLPLRSLSYVEVIPVIERWEQFMKDQLKKMPPELQSGFQTTVYAWHWVNVQRELAENAVLGIVLGLSLACPVLVLSTCNLLNGLLATLTICCVTICVIGVIPLGGWKLGVLVSLNMCLVVGLAVDFVVHLAEGYHMSHRKGRRGRLQQALERMGVSVFSGACTTLGASAFMLFAKLQFVFQFGIFMFCTIGFSLVFSMGLYVTVMGILGPQGDTGDIRVLFKKCCAHLRPGKGHARTAA